MSIWETTVEFNVRIPAYMLLVWTSRVCCMWTQIQIFLYNSKPKRTKATETQLSFQHKLCKWIFPIASKPDVHLGARPNTLCIFIFCGEEVLVSILKIWTPLLTVQTTGTPSKKAGFPFSSCRSRTCKCNSISIVRYHLFYTWWHWSSVVSFNELLFHCEMLIEIFKNVLSVNSTLLKINFGLCLTQYLLLQSQKVPVFSVYLWM